MGRVKLEIKRIENIANRKISFRKRRDGLMKKAFELSVLCEVDVAVITFSLTGKLRIFSGNNKSIEDIIERFFNTPNYERRRLENREYLRKPVDHKLEAVEANKIVYSRTNMSKSKNQVEELQQEIIACKDQQEALKKRLRRIIESDHYEVATLSEAHNRECVVHETLSRTLVEENNHPQAGNVISQVQIPLSHDLISKNNSSGGTSMDWLSPRLYTNGQDNMNFLNPPNLIPRNQPFISLDNTQLQSQPPFFYEENLRKFTTSDGDKFMHLNAPQLRQNMEFNPSICPEFDIAGNNEIPSCSTSQVDETTRDLFNELFG